MSSGTGHASGAAGRAYAAILAREGDEQLVAASGTADAGEAMAEDAAAQVARKFLGDEGGQLAAGIAIGGFSKECGQILADDAVEQRPLGLSPLVAKPRTGWAVRGRRIGYQSEHRVVPITSHA
ncbi:MAG TPA: hypothetical protein PLW65_06225, partial [Pseudomonadota bacterium]|nr:hypothetical protein [Pseudomonadota bacterium]